MNESKYLSLVFPFIFLLLVTGVAYDQQLKLPFQEIAQSSDFIFVGTVEKQISRLNELNTMIFTDVFFKDIFIIHATDLSVQKNSSVVRLTYAGGRVGEQGVTVSGTPAFKDGHRYLIFMLDDGKTYANPIVGGFQGLFEVVKDVFSHEEFILTAGRKAVIGANTNGIEVGKERVSHIKGGIPVNEELQKSILDRFYSQPPTPVDPTDSALLSEQGPMRKVERIKPLRLEEFLNYIRDVALKLPLERKMLKRDGHGSFFRNNGIKEEVEELKVSKPPVRLLDKEQDYEKELHVQHEVPRGDANLPPVFSRQPATLSIFGGTLGACGHHNLHLTMEQVPSSWWSYPINNDCMWTWNQFMDIYRHTDDDGSFGNNSQNEFCGWVDDATLYSVYGYNWGGGIAMCITWWFLCECCEITQSDVIWNSAYSWTSDAEFAIGNTSVILLRPVNMHELGHSWGEQRGSYVETYDYDVPSVMHSYYSYIVESGWGIHWSDAYLIRQQYDDQISILSTNDVGVESYYASNGLINSSTNASTYLPGQSITLYNVTVENISYSSVSDLRIRFYLSTNRTITTSDYQMGSYWYWTSFSGEAYNVGNYTTTIPLNIPAGTYYLGAIVTINGFGDDDYTYNNSTSFLNQITVQGLPPVADFVGNPTSGCAPLTVTFTDQSQNATSWSWSFVGGNPSSATGQGPHQVTYYNSGSYSVSLDVTGSGGSDSETKNNYIAVMSPPTADFNGNPTIGPVPLQVTFTDQSSGNPTSWSWSFPGGTPSSATGQGPHMVTYNSAGDFNVTLQASNSCGSDTETKTNYIHGYDGCVADFLGNPTSGQAPLPVTFTDQSTGNPTSWSWTFTGGSPSSATGQGPHMVTYNSAGDFSVTLNITCPSGSDSETKTNYIHVTPPSQPDVFARINGCPATPSQGAQWTVPIYIDMSQRPAPDNNLGSFTGTLSYNTSDLTYSSNSGILAGFTGSVNPTPGNISFNGANPSGATGDIKVVEITFDVIGSCDIHGLLDLQFSAMSSTSPYFTNLIPFLSVTDCDYTISCGILGDVNDDTFANSTDALIVLSCDVGINVSQFCHQINCGDVNGDGLINSTDALIILSYDVGISVPFPVGQPGCPSNVTTCPGCNP